MRLIIVLSLLFSSTVFSKSKFTPSTFEVIALNSPVKESVAKFQIKVPAGFEIDKARYKIKNVIDIFNKSDKHDPLTLTKQGSDYIASVNVSKLSPGQYQFFLKIIDKKTKKEHVTKQKRKHIQRDYANFIIDSSLQVPAPDPKKDAATLEGIDTNNDGLPDRLERWINESSYSEDMKEALKQKGRFYQLVLINHKDPILSVKSLDSMIQTNSCVSALSGPTIEDLDRSHKIQDQLKSIFLNTEKRIFAYRLANTHASGTGGTIPNDETKEARCNF